MTSLHIPDITPDHDPISAALAYAKAGWYVLPVNRATKHPGSVLGKGWPAKSSRDAPTIVDWFAGTDHALALHVGRSGAIAFDVDRPDELPPLLVAVFGMVPGPFQSTRDNNLERGHYLYAAPLDRSLGNSTGRLGKTWGEVRGKNGVIVVAPSDHEKAALGGRYQWERTGDLPMLPTVLADELPDAGDSNDAATDREVKAFLDRHTANARPELLHGVLTQFSTALATGESRHGIALRATAGAMREAAAGLYPAMSASTALLGAFTAAMQTSRDGHERTLPQAQARAEFLGILSWAVAQCAAADLAAVRTAVDERLPHSDEQLVGLIAPAAPTTPAVPLELDETAELYALIASQGPPPFAVEGNLATVLQLPVEQSAEDAQERTSWWPRTLGSILAGVEEEPPPAFLARQDGVCLFYAAKVNAILGESESGKTWVMMLGVAQALHAGGRVVYIDFEDTPAGIIGRLRALGVPDDTIMARLSYIGPDEMLHATASQDLREHLEQANPGLVVLDGWNAAMTLLGLDLNSNTDATRFSQMLLKPLSASGAAVVAIDHVPKNKEARGKGGIGAQAKRAMLTGCSIVVEVAEPFGRGMTGRLRLYVDKDRAGHVRAVSAEAKFAGTAVLESDANTGGVTVSIRPPDMGTRTERIVDRREPLMEKLSAHLQGAPERSGLKVLRAAMGGKAGEVDEALDELIKRGHVTRTTSGQAFVHTLVRPFSVLTELAGVGAMSGSPVSVPPGHGGHGTENSASESYSPVSNRIGTRSGHGSVPPSNRVPPPPFRGGDTVEGTDDRDPSDLITSPSGGVMAEGLRIDPATGELLDAQDAL